MPNIYEPDFEPGERPEGFRARRARIGYQLGSELLGCSLFELPPGEAAYPYHFHYADEEIVIVVRGRPTLRSPGGTRSSTRGRRCALRSARRARTRSSTTARRPSRSWRSPATGGPTSSSTPTRARSES